MINILNWVNEMSKLKLKRRSSLKFLKYPLFLLILVFLVNYFFKDINLNSNTQFVNNLLQRSNYHLLPSEQEFNFFGEFVKVINRIELKEPITIIDKAFAYNNEENIEQVFSYVQNNVVTNPRVYIYSTHPNEKYEGERLEGYELDNTVVLASLLLQEKLNAMGIMTLVEERSASQYIKDNNLSYNQSYQATREFLKDQLANNEFDLIIDLHRDAIAKDKTTTQIDNKNYAKVMFVVNVNYKDNIALANELNDIIEKNYPTLSRGLYNKYVDNFNQDLADNVLLLELGGNYNTMDEVVNSVDAVANSIKELLK